jgi:hypothetical protein
MIQLNAGNVLLKPTHRRHIMTCLRRASKLGQRIGDFVLNLTLTRSGRAYELRASVKDRAGAFSYRIRRSDWRSGIRELTHMIVGRLHAQYLLRAA